MFVLDKSSYDSSEFITLLYGDLVCYYTTLALLVLPPPLPRLQDGPLVHGFSLVKVCKVLYSLVGHTLHLLFIFLSLLNSTESFLLDPVFPGVFLTMTKLLLATSVYCFATCFHTMSTLVSSC